MDAKELIARRVALELRDNTLVNLGIGLPTLVARYIPAGLNIAFQSENGLIGFASPAPKGMENPNLTDAGNGPIMALPGAAAFDSAMSFALMRGGHLDMTVLGGLQVDRWGRLANWMAPGKRIPGMGGAMDLVAGAKRVIVAMQHTMKDGGAKIVERLTYPPTSMRRVDLIVTELGVFEPTDDGLVLREWAPDVTIYEIVAKTEAKLTVSNGAHCMPLL